MRGNDRLVLVAHFVIPAKAGTQRPFAAATSLYTGLCRLDWPHRTNPARQQPVRRT